METKHHQPKGVTMTNFSTTVTPAEAETPWKDGAYRLACTCGEQVTYRGFYFTQVEAQRHQAWHGRKA
jgi:hypothetical protein